MSKAKEWGERLEKLIAAYEQRIAELERQLAAKAEPPDDLEWQPVDAEHPLTEADHGRWVRFRHGVGQFAMQWKPHITPVCAGGVWTDEGGMPVVGGNPHNCIIAVLRPKPAPDPQKPQPGEVWESVTAEITGCGIMRGEIVNTSNGMVYLLDAQGDGQHLVGFAIEGDRLRCRFWNDRKLTRRVS